MNELIVVEKLAEPQNGAWSQNTAHRRARYLGR